MSLKVLCDALPSAHPSHCSSHFKIAKLIDYVLNEQGRDDVFFYWMIPDWASEESREWLPKHPNIRYIEYPYNRDRMREYLIYDRALDMIQGFNGTDWDFDILFTSRTSLIPFSRAAMTSPRQTKIGRSLKKIICFDEMFVVEGRPTVAKSDIAAQEMMVLTGYLASDLVVMTTQLERKMMLQTARRYFAPSQVREIENKIKLGPPVAFRDVYPKEDQFRFKGDRPLCVGFSGRLERSAAKLEELYGIMTAQYALMKADNPVRFVIPTVTTMTMLPPPPFVEWINPSREEFWRLCKEEIDVLISLQQNVEFSLSFVEPIMMGVPMIVVDQEWSRSVLGDDYPFYVPNDNAAYAFAKEFQENYAERYAQFEAWQTNHFAPMFQPGGQYDGDYFAEVYKVFTDLDAFKANGELVKVLGGRLDNGMFLDMLKQVEGRDEFVLFEMISELKQYDIMQQKITEGRDGRRVVFATAWNELRLMFQVHGWVDASTKVGHFKRAPA